MQCSIKNHKIIWKIESHTAHDWLFIRKNSLNSFESLRFVFSMFLFCFCSACFLFSIFVHRLSSSVIFFEWFEFINWQPWEQFLIIFRTTLKAESCQWKLSEIRLDKLRTCKKTWYAAPDGTYISFSPRQIKSAIWLALGIWIWLALRILRKCQNKFECLIFEMFFFYKRTETNVKQTVRFNSRQIKLFG